MSKTRGAKRVGLGGYPQTQPYGRRRRPRECLPAARGQTRNEKRKAGNDAHKTANSGENRPTISKGVQNLSMEQLKKTGEYVDMYLGGDFGVAVIQRWQYRVQDAQARSAARGSLHRLSTSTVATTGKRATQMIVTRQSTAAAATSTLTPTPTPRGDSSSYSNSNSNSSKTATNVCDTWKHRPTRTLSVGDPREKRASEIFCLRSGPYS